VFSYDGTRKCLDYGTPPPPFTEPSSGVRITGTIGIGVIEGAASTGSSQNPPAVFLNDCDHANPIVVEEIANGAAFPAGTTSPRAHQVILHAGDKVIGIPRTGGTNRNSGAAPGVPGDAVADIPLQLFDPRSATTPSVNDVFELDGDSIILASSRPCINTDAVLCAPPPPEFVVQVQNGRGFNGTPIVLGERHLSDQEFWDFVATDGSGAFPTTGFVNVGTADELWDYVCAPHTILGRPYLNGDQKPPDKTLDGGRLDAPVPCTNFVAGWGTVIVISSPFRCDHVAGDDRDVGYCIDMSEYAPLILPAGVTLRGAGGRRGINFGAQLYAAYSFERLPGYDFRYSHDCISCMIQIRGDYSRVTGLRLRGQSRSLHIKDVDTEAIVVSAPAATNGPSGSLTEFIAHIDHNDISDWEDAAVVAGGTDTALPSVGCGGAKNDEKTLNNVHIARNFLHDNERWSGGYGVNMGHGGRAFVEGNTFMMNRPAVTADGYPHDEYRAWYNLVLRMVPNYSDSDSGKTGVSGPQQIFDMHGTSGSDPGYGGLGGYSVDIAGNTLLGNAASDFGHPLDSFELRGTPCATPSYFRHNITRQKQQDAIYLHKVNNDHVTVQQLGPEVPSTPVAVPPDPTPCLSCNLYASSWSPAVLAENNRYADSAGFSDPTDTEPPYGSGHPFGVGDFDSDGMQDLFLATGTAWYFAPGGTAEWRFLSARTDKIETLLFGDFDGDGRTDVVTKRGAYLWVSWGGASDWEMLNNDPRLGSVQITDLAAGKFLDHQPGDRRDDIFLADGENWYLSFGGSGLFKYAKTSPLLVKNVRFGDFDGDGKTDVFGVISSGSNNWWAFTKSARGPWINLQPARGYAVVADFDGNGIADVAAYVDAYHWAISYGGTSPYTVYPINYVSPCLPVNIWPFVPGVGFFRGGKGADILLWMGYPLDPGATFNSSGNGLCIARGGDGTPGQVGWTAGVQMYSRQDMR
jgi:hypothetical protein